MFESKCKKYNKTILFVTHEPLDSNLVESQFFPFINQANNLYNIHIFSCESMGKKKLNYETTSFNANNSYLYKCFKLIRCIFNSKDIKWIHSRSYFFLPPLILICLFTKIKFVFDPRGAFPEEIKLKNKNFLIVNIFKILECIALRISNFVVVVSNQMASHYVKYNNKQKYIIVPCEPNLKCKKNAPMIQRPVSDTLNLLYIGSAEPWQNIKYIIELARYAIEKGNDVKLHVYTTDRENFLSYINFKNYENFIFINSGSTKDIFDNVKRDMVAIIVREDNVINNVSCPVKFVEYLQFELHILCSKNIGDLSNLVSEYDVGTVIDVNSDLDYVINLLKSRVYDFEYYARYSSLNSHLEDLRIKSLDRYKELLEN